MANQTYIIESVPWLGICEPFSSISHFVGAFIFAALAIPLICKSRGDWIRTSSIVVFAVCGFVQLLISSNYHALWPGPTREFMLRVDVATIFLLIAGSITPVYAILFQGTHRLTALVLIWTVAISAIIWRTLFCDTNPGSMGIAFFILCGWSCSYTAHELRMRYGWSFIQPIFLSGFVYTLGAIGLALHWPHPIPGVIGPHDVWHLAVLAGLILHWRFVSQFAAGSPIPISINETLEVAPAASLER